MFSIQAWAQTDSVQRRIAPARDTVKKTDTARKAPATTVPPVATSATDSVKHNRAADSIKMKADSLAKAAAPTIVATQHTVNWQEDTLFQHLFKNPYLPIGKTPVFMVSEYKVLQEKDQLFYVLMGLLLILGFIRASFPKYFTYMFMLIRQTSFRQKQTREQLLQGRLPSLMMNLLFIMVAAIYISIVATQKKLTHITFWYFVLYSMLILSAVYLLKFLFLRFTGWVFRVSEAAETYIFIVFLVNKLLAVALLPLVWLLAYSTGDLNVIVFTISTFLIGILLIYRYILSLAAVRNMVRISPFHFFIYLCAVEILPVLLIYKILFSKLGLSI
ncbi:hypothetical protein FLA_6320 [Filimonas lacunae]|nr:hypothetical protein FLA_6320 [Filimonas lacunae]